MADAIPENEVHNISEMTDESDVNTTRHLWSQSPVLVSEPSMQENTNDMKESRNEVTEEERDEKPEVGEGGRSSDIYSREKGSAEGREKKRARFAVSHLATIY